MALEEEEEKEEKRREKKREERKPEKQRRRGRGREVREKTKKQMRFLQNLISYWANLVLVETLANSRTFQRFAISTDKLLKELKKNGKVT